jgi:hypothetical protein
VTPSRVLFELESLAARIGISVRTETFGAGLLQGRGGLCWVRGKPLVVMDATLAAPDRIAVLAVALGRFELEGLYIAPAVREIIEKARAKAGSRPIRTRTRATPGLARGRPKGR